MKTEENGSGADAETKTGTYIGQFVKQGNGEQYLPIAVGALRLQHMADAVAVLLHPLRQLCLQRFGGAGKYLQLHRMVFGSRYGRPKF